MTDNERNLHAIPTQLGRPSTKAEAYLDYYGEPDASDDPADYYDANMRGVRIA